MDSANSEEIASVIQSLNNTILSHRAVVSANTERSAEVGEADPVLSYSREESPRVTADGHVAQMIHAFNQSVRDKQDANTARLDKLFNETPDLIKQVDLVVVTPQATSINVSPNRSR